MQSKLDNFDNIKHHFGLIWCIRGAKEFNLPLVLLLKRRVLNLSRQIRYVEGLSLVDEWAPRSTDPITETWKPLSACKVQRTDSVLVGWGKLCGSSHHRLPRKFPTIIYCRQSSFSALTVPSKYELIWYEKL